MKLFIVLALLALTAFSFNSEEAFNKKYSVKILNEGTFDKYPVKGDKVSVHYVNNILIIF